MPRSTAIHVDRERFLFLAAALAAASCTARPPAELPTPEMSAPTPDGQASEQTTPAAGPMIIVEPPPNHQPPNPPPNPPIDAIAEPSGPTCDNDVGRVDCSALSSTCESLDGSCGMLAQGYPYRARVAEAVALCWARVGDRACNMRARQECYREGIGEGCLDPRFEPECEARLRACRDAGVSASYTLNECVQVLSSLSDEGERDWASGAMGPTREGCRLMFPVY
jgi:hypothetical protein